MPLYSPPRDFVQALHNFDKDLRVRWSDGQGKWRLERKVSRGTVWPPSELDTPAAHEDRIAARDGYILVDLLPELSNRLFSVLRAHDIWAHGGAEAVADQMDRMDVLQKYELRKLVLDYAESTARERWRYMNTVRTVPEKSPHSAPAGGMSINGGV